ncbi:facilitated trehalose transporter Tret1-2 homolog [Glossina fuscipes]|uniref:Facilitated trehalose transporter Tret1-2 homolog n=1 Tax=Glossina fuscipes TaxID=7396 RepID=A0A9C6DQP5_9MUSC|nr:facilitated trehalose transporter Tret1-2 homolog [Glossina fuscipes]XP_037887672.1 facilitated trehalose transporter Tret1-2 homolog [Glossina fuscipes]
MAGSGPNKEEFQALHNDETKARIASNLNHPYEPKPLGEQSRALNRQTIMVIIGNLGVMSIGMGLGLPTVTQRPMTDTTEQVYLTQSQFTWFASLNLLAAPLGGLLSGVLLDKLGRKCTIYCLNILGLTSWILLAVASKEDNDIMFLQLMASRFLVGVTHGLSSAPVGVYSAEISTPKIRGRLILGTSISVSLGITVIYVLGYFIRTDWRLIGWICTGFQVLALMSVLPMPESPNWLISKGRLQEARKSLNYFRGLDKKATITHPEVLAEFNVLQKNIHLAEGQKMPSFWKSLRLPEVYKPLLILIGMFTFQQLTGIFVIIVYAVQISVEAGVTMDPFMCAVLIGLARLITTCPMAYLLEKWGRRRAGIISAAGMTVCMILLAAQSYLRVIPFLPVIAIVSFIVLSTLGIFTLPFFMISELFPQHVRGRASGLTVAFGLLAAFFCTKTYPGMKDAIGNEYCFVVYGAVSFAAMIFVYLVLPETRRRTLFEIEEQFRMKKPLKPTQVEMREICIK